jgi:Protein of unknown function (DUF4238)
LAGKDHHFVPQMLLRRYAIRAGEPQAGLVWRGNLDGSLLRTVAPKDEAAKRQYYRMPSEIETGAGMPVEDLLQKIENGASVAMIKFERGRLLNEDDRHWLAFFLLLQHRRTPAGRRQLRFMDETLATLDYELRLSDRAFVRTVVEQGRDGSVSESEVAEWQEQTLGELRRGELVIRSTPDREVALMFVGLDKLVPALLTEFDWCFLRIPADVGEVVLPDVGVTLYDPTPRFPQSGTGLASSPNSETVLHFASSLVLVLRPGCGTGTTREASPHEVERLNLRAVANSDRCIYGSSERLVASVLASAAADPERVASLRARPPVMWVAEGRGEPKPGPMTFTGESLAGRFTQDFRVSREALEESRS